MSQADVDLVYALLRSYADWEPSIRVSSSRGALRGEAEGGRRPCAACDGIGRLKGGASCRICKGTGSVAYDPQTLHAVASEDLSYAALIKRRRVDCDRCGGSGKRAASSSLDPGMHDRLELSDRGHRWHLSERDRCPDCAGTGTVEIIDERATDASLRMIERQWFSDGEDVGEDELDRAWRRRREQWAKGSYAPLERLLEALALDRPGAFRMLDRHLIHPHAGVLLGERITLTIDDLVAELAHAMPRPIRVPAEARRAWADEQVKHDVWRRRGPSHRVVRAERDDQLRSLVDRGMSLGQAARLFRISHRRARQIVAEGQPAMVATGPAA